MKINLDVLREYSKTILTVCPKTGNMEFDSLYFDFDARKIIFHNEYVFGAIDFDFEAEQDEDYSNMFIDLHKFLFLIASEDDITLKFTPKPGGSLIPRFYNSSGKYVLTHLIRDEQLNEELESFVKEYYQVSHITLTEDLIATLKETTNFIGVNDNEFNSVVLLGNTLHGTTPDKYFHNELEVSFDEEITLHKSLIKLLGTLKEADISLKIKHEGIYSLEKANKIFLLLTSDNPVHTQVPGEEDIEGIISFDTQVTVEKAVLLENIKFFDPFYSQDSKPVAIAINDGVMILSTVSDSDDVSKEISLAYSDESLNGFKAEFDSITMKNAIGVLSTDHVSLYIDPEKDAIAIAEKDSTKKYVAVMQYDS